MKQEICMPEEIWAYEKRLRPQYLKWPVKWCHASVESTCRCVTDKKNKNHEIWVTSQAYSRPSLYIVDLSHELCHCALAELIGTAFSTVWFSEKWNQIYKKDTKNFSKKAQMLYLSLRHIAIWVNQFRHKFWPELTKEDLDSFSAGVLYMLQQRGVGSLNNHESIIAIAQHQAERRLAQDIDLFSVLSANRIRVDKKIKKLADFYKSLPALSYEPAKDLKILEVSVQESAKILGFPINPSLVFEEDWVWDLG